MYNNSQRKRGKLIRGTIGAILGSLIGVAVWVLINQLGYLSALAGCIMVVCALKGYEIFGKALDTKGVVIACLVSVFMVLFAERVSLAIEIYNAYNHVGRMNILEAFKAVPEFMEMEEIRRAVIGDLVMGYFLMLVGAFGTVIRAFKESRGVQNKNVPLNGNEYEGTQQWMK